VRIGGGLARTQSDVRIGAKQQQNLTIPANMLAACAAQGIPTVGNGGGNSVDWYDLKNALVHPNKSPWG
jgi:hypothetical protein